MLEVSNRLLSHPAANVAAARPVNTSIALVCRYARRFLRSAPALLVVALWLSSQAFAQTTHRLRPETVAAPATTPCYGTCQVPVSCPSGSPTTVTGKVYVPKRRGSAAEYAGLYPQFAAGRAHRWSAMPGGRDAGFR